MASLAKKTLPSEMVYAIQNNGKKDEFFERLKGDLHYLEGKYNDFDFYNHGEPANFELAKEEGDYIYFDVVDQNSFKISALALSTKTLAFYIQSDQITNAVHYLIDETKWLLEMYTWDYLYKGKETKKTYGTFMERLSSMSETMNEEMPQN